MDYPAGPRASVPVSEQTRTQRLRHLLTSGKLVICPWKLEAHGSLAILLVTIIVLLAIL
jgi:hypothetical protein